MSHLGVRAGKHRSLSTGQRCRHGGAPESPTFVEPIHVELSNKRRDVGMLKVGPSSGSAAPWGLGFLVAGIREDLGELERGVHDKALGRWRPRDQVLY